MLGAEVDITFETQFGFDRPLSYYTELGKNFGVAFHNVWVPEPAGTIHDARKTFCTLTAAVVPMATLRRWAGHSKIETTAIYYCREREADADRLRDAMRDDTSGAADLRLVG